MTRSVVFSQRGLMALPALLLLIVVALSSSPAPASADGPTSLGRTPWERFGPNPIVSPVPNYGTHGDPRYYDHIPGTIPSGDDAGWGPAPNGDTIGFSVASRLSVCWTQIDYNYFQTFVDIPEGTVLSDFTIDFSGMDDGSRITIFNSANPGGAVIPGSYVYLGATGTTDLAPYIVEGETNRVVVTQIDDCPVGNNLHSAVVNLGGEVIVVDPNEPPVADAGGPYTVYNGSTVNLDGTGSSDPDGDAITFEWDLDNDGTFETSGSNPDFDGVGGPAVHDVTLRVCDPDGLCDEDATTVEVLNNAPVCDAAAPTVASIWPPNHQMVPVGIEGVTDADGDEITISVTGITQDEKVLGKGSGNHAPDGAGVGTDTAEVRAEREGTKGKNGSNGRVYEISFTADDGNGGSCSGTVQVGVPHDQKPGNDPVDDGQAYDSTVS